MYVWSLLCVISRHCNMSMGCNQYLCPVGWVSCSALMPPSMSAGMHIFFLLTIMYVLYAAIIQDSRLHLLATTMTQSVLIKVYAWHACIHARTSSFRVKSIQGYCAGNVHRGTVGEKVKRKQYRKYFWGIIKIKMLNFIRKYRTKKI